MIGHEGLDLGVRAFRTPQFPADPRAGREFFRRLIERELVLRVAVGPGRYLLRKSRLDGRTVQTDYNEQNAYERRAG